MRAPIGQRVTVVQRDVLDDEPPDVDIVLAGDCWYDAGLAARVLPWLQRVRDRGIDVLVGDPGRRFLPAHELVELAAYEVRTTTELEDLPADPGPRLRPATGRGRLTRRAPPMASPPRSDYIAANVSATSTLAPSPSTGQPFARATAASRLSALMML